MAWKGRDKDIEADFAQLISSLNNSRIQTENNALYQVIYQLVLAAQKNKNLNVKQFAEIIEQLIAISNSLVNINTVIAALENATVWTQNDETAILVNSNKVIAGTGILLDYTVPNEVTISTSGGLGNHYDSPLSDGDLIAAELIFAAGECVIVQVPV